MLPRDSTIRLMKPSDDVAILDGLTATKVLDPACGTGNFLYVADGDKLFLKTIIPSRKMTKKYLGDTQ